MTGPRCPICDADLREWRLDARNVLLRCESCGHLVRDLELCPAAARDAAYGGDAALDRLRVEVTRRRLRRVLPGGARVFEIGFGSGALLRRLAADGFQVGGVDPGQLAVRRQPGLPPSVRSGDATSLRLQDGEEPYDVVIAVHVLEHVAAPLQVLDSARRLLRPGGQVWLLTPSADCLGLSWFGAAWWMLEDPTHIAFFSPDSVRRALHRVGFTDVSLSRPRLESLTCEAASLLRRGRTGEVGGAGVLADRRTAAITATLAPLDLLARVLWPKLAPALLARAFR